MPRAFTVANNLEIGGWVRGLLSAAISGGASAITGGIVVSGIDPSNYNFQAGKFWILTGTLFAVNAVVSMAKFLQAHPLPEEKTVERKTQIIETPGSPAVTVTTVKETTIEPKDVK